MRSNLEQPNLRFILNLIIAIMMLSILSPAASLAQDGDRTETTTRTITVAGLGTASGSPDLAIIDVGVERQNADVGTAFEEVNQTMDDVISSLIELGIAEEDIQTQSYNIHQQAPPLTPESQPNEEETIYVVSNTAQIRVRNIEQISEVIQVALDAGANRMYGLNFSLDDTTDLASEAREIAFNDAQTRAEALADLFGVTLAEVIEINEVNGGGGRVPADAAAIGGGGPAISTGQLAITVEIDVTYAITSP